MHPVLHQHIGQEADGRRAKDPVNQFAIRQWCEAVDDWNPAYLDPDWASAHRFGAITAPATSLNMWTLPGNRQDQVGAAEPLAELYRDLASLGFTSLAAVRGHQVYRRPLVLGDHLSLRQRIDEISELKTTSLGDGHFITFTHDYTSHGEYVGSVSLSVLVWDPSTSTPSTSRPQPEFGRPRPPDESGSTANGGTLVGLVPAAPGNTGEQAAGPSTGYPGTRSVPARINTDDGRTVDAILTGLPDLATASPGARVTRSWATADGRDVYHLARPERAQATPELAEALSGPVWTVPITQAQIACLAIATLDFNDVHLDRDIARARGGADVYLNILGSNGLVNCYLTDWLGPEIELTSFSTALLSSAYPGDFLSLWGQVTGRTQQADRTCLEVEVIGRHCRGDHIRVTCALTIERSDSEAQHA